MAQLSFFSADTDEPVYDDLGGLLAAHGQASRSEAGTRISVVVADPWRAQALVRELLATGLPAEVAASEEGSPIARTAPSEGLDALNERWSAGAVKSVPQGWIPSPRALRLWTIAAGTSEGEDRFLLGLDPHAPETHSALATSLMRVGIAPTLVGTRGNAPALRVTGRRRMARLAEYVGEAPAIAGASRQWPHWPDDLHIEQHVDPHAADDHPFGARGGA